MLKDCLLRRRWLVYSVIVWGIYVATAPHLAAAAPVPPGRVETGRSLESAQVLLEQKIIRERLVALGVSPAEAASTLARLSPEERNELAERVQEIEGGGNGFALIGLAVIVAALVVLILELMGRHVISRR
ncbi:MAG: PA2779 family protein [Candidatus Rokubacteria bacterium]|nr:PA2779 family protein [Candidatus Rokubacteria bacterium]